MMLLKIARKVTMLMLPFLMGIFGCSTNKSFLKSSLFKNVGPYLYYYEGIQNRLYGNPQLALENLIKANKLYPNNAAIHYELALNYLTVNNIPNSIFHSEQSVILDNENIYYRNFLGMLYINTSQIDKAIINQESIVAFDTTNTYNRFQLSLLYSEAKRFDDAIKEINKLESSVGFSPNLSETKTRIFFETNSSEQAKEEIDKLLDFNPNHPLYLLYGSDVDFREGKDSLAFAKIYRAIEIDPSFTLGYVELYQRYIDVGNHLNALNVLKILFTEHSIPDNELVRLFYPILFEQYYYTQHSQFLDSLIDIGLQKFPSSLSLNELAYEHYLRRQDFAKARLYLDKLVKIDENNPIRWERLINFDYSVGVKEMVVFNSIKAINLFPDNYIFYIFNSISLGDINDFQGAINVLVKGTSKVTNPNHVSELYGSIGDFYFRLNDLKSSFKAYRKSLQHNPNNARVLNNYSYYLAINEMNLSKALDMSSKAVELEPNNSTYIDTKGWVLFTMKRYEEARDVLRNAIAKSGSTSAVINEHYGDALYQTGNKENAYIYWLKAKEIGGGSPKLEIKIRDKAYVP